MSKTFEKWEYLLICIEECLLEECQEEIEYTGAILSEKLKYICKKEIFLEVVKRILFLMEKKPEFYMQEVKALISILYIENYRRNTEKDIILEKAFEYIYGHYMEEISLQKLAEICKMSQSQFRRRFKREVSITPQDYICRVRMGKACELLRTEEDHISIIACKVGFKNLSSFDRSFKRILKISPREWRGIS